MAYGLWPVRWQTIIWTNCGMLLIGTLEANFSEILIQIHNIQKCIWKCLLQHGALSIGLNLIRNNWMQKTCTSDVIITVWPCVFRLEWVLEWNIIAVTSNFPSYFGRSYTAFKSVFIWPELCIIQNKKDNALTVFIQRWSKLAPIWHRPITKISSRRCPSILP